MKMKMNTSLLLLLWLLLSKLGDKELYDMSCFALCTSSFFGG
jgi:hypothetical protein